MTEFQLSEISLNVIIPTVVIALISVIVPYYFNKQKEDFQHKLRILDETVSIERNLFSELHTFLDIINWKYCNPLLKSGTIVWCLRDKPLDDKDLNLETSNIKDEYNKILENITKNFMNRKNGYLQLYRTNEMDSYIGKSGILLLENQTLLFQISYEPNGIKSIIHHLGTIRKNFYEINIIKEDLLRLYMKRFRKKYWFNRRIIDIKSIFKGLKVNTKLQVLYRHKRN